MVCCRQALEGEGDAQAGAAGGAEVGVEVDFAVLNGGVGRFSGFSCSGLHDRRDGEVALVVVCTLRIILWYVAVA